MQKKLNLTLRLAVSAAALVAMHGTAYADTPQCLNGPPGQIWKEGDPYDGYPMPRPGMTPGYAPPSQVTVGNVTTVHTGQSLFTESEPWDNPTNLLPTVYHDVYDSLCNMVPNTTTSTPENPYNLHPAPIETDIDKSSPFTDLEAIFNGFHSNGATVKIDKAKVQRAIDILEGNAIPGKMYSGMPVLHYNGPAKSRAVEQIKDSQGNVIGGNVNVHMIFYRSHIESDVSLIDTMPVMNVPWTVTYTVDSLDKGADDFSPSTMYFDDPNAFGGLQAGVSSMRPLIMEDLTFFPQKEGKRYVYKIAMAPGRYFNGTYTWGWRVHPGRVQFMENKNKAVAGLNLEQWEIDAFGQFPTANRANQVAAINKISNLAPEKRMWTALNTLRDNPALTPRDQQLLVAELEASFDDWDHRGRLPRGVTPDPNADITLFYANNTIYADVKGYTDPNAHMEFTAWKTRSQGADVKVKILNGDYYKRGYMSVDFGGMRGWENTFQNTVPVGGDGAWFTFGREHWWPNVTPVIIAPAVPATPLTTVTTASAASMKRNPAREFRMAENDPDGLTVSSNLKATATASNGDTFGEHLIDLHWNFDPSLRLRFYQFDPLHHDVAVFSMH